MVTIKWELHVDGKALGDTLSIEGCNPRHSESRDFEQLMALLKVVLAENLEHLTGEKGPKALALLKRISETSDP